MKLLCFVQRPSSVSSALILIALLFTANLSAQSRKSARSSKPVAKKSEKSAKDARKEKASAKSKNSRKTSATERASAKSRDKNEKKVDRKDTKRSAAARRAEAERRRAEEIRRQAIIAEQRRREQAAREARARKLAFERSLHTETTSNISHDNTDGEDLQVRRAAVNALGSHAGTVVVMEAQTGKVVTIVNQEWAIRNGFKPCSTIKLVTGVAGLSENIIDDEGNINGVTTRRQLQDAIAFSDNGYFQRVGSNLGSSKMVSYAHRLGLGEPTGINAEGETAGRVPNGNNNARIYSHGDDFEVTPLQLAVLVSAITNGGKRVVPQIPKNSFQTTNFRGQLKQQVNLPKQDLQGMVPGMIGAAEYGTAHRGVDASLGIAGKTGSCIAKGSWVGLFASVAPVENPKYSVVVITRGQGERGKYAAAVAGKIYQALAPRLGQRANHPELLAPYKPKPAIDNKTTAAADDEDEDEDDTAEASADTADDEDAAPARNVSRPVPVQKPAEKKLITKTVKSTPAFAPVVITYSKDKGDGSTRPRIVKNK